jgi:hypothetical protein
MVADGPAYPNGVPSSRVFAVSHDQVPANGYSRSANLQHAERLFILGPRQVRKQCAPAIGVE